jgi:hypothetical protein
MHATALAVLLGTGEMAQDLHAYYAGERTSAYVVGILGGAAVVGGSVLAAQPTDFARGLGWPLIVMGALEGLGAIFYTFQVNAEIKHYVTELDRDGAAFRKDEITHMRGTTSRFVFYRLAELGLFLVGVGIATGGFLANADTWKGIGIGIGGIAVLFLIIDTINNNRAGWYQTQLRDYTPIPERTNVPAAAVTPWFFSYGGRF